MNLYSTSIIYVAKIYFLIKPEKDDQIGCNDLDQDINFSNSHWLNYMYYDHRSIIAGIPPLKYKLVQFRSHFKVVTFAHVRLPAPVKLVHLLFLFFKGLFFDYKCSISNNRLWDFCVRKFSRSRGQQSLVNWVFFILLETESHMLGGIWTKTRLRTPIFKILALRVSLIKFEPKSGSWYNDME